MKELVKCEECVFYEDCEEFEGNYKCPQAVNFDNLMWTVLKGKILQTIKDEIRIVVKDILKRYDSSIVKERKSSLTARERIKRFRNNVIKAHEKKP